MEPGGIIQTWTIRKLLSLGSSYRKEFSCKNRLRLITPRFIIFSEFQCHFKVCEQVDRNYRKAHITRHRVTCVFCLCEFFGIRAHNSATANELYLWSQWAQLNAIDVSVSRTSQAMISEQKYFCSREPKIALINPHPSKPVTSCMRTGYFEFLPFFLVYNQ